MSDDAPAPTRAMPEPAIAHWFQQLFDASPDPSWIIEGSHFVECNQASVRFLGYTNRDELLNIHPASLSPERQPDGEVSRDKAERMIATVRTNGLHRFEWMHCKRDGSEFLAEVTLSNLHFDQRTIIYCVWRDISERKKTESRLAQSESRLKNILEGAADALFIVDEQGRYQYTNQQATALLGYSYDEFLDLGIFDLTPTEDHSAIRSDFGELQGKGEVRRDIRLKCADGRIIPVELNARLLDDGNCIGSCRDITERKKSEDRITYMAHHDALTGLFNRSHLTARMEQALATATREHRPLAVLFLDLDRFKAINDTLGHACGDALLIEVARRLTENVRGSDIVARLGGDEFVVILTDIENAPAAARLAEKILTSLGLPYFVCGHQVHTTPSIGLSFFPTDGEDGDTLMKHADAAMYHAKSQGRNNIQFYSHELNRYAMRRMRVEHEMHEALTSNRFELYYQPQIDASNQRIVGVEALLRWHTSQNELAMPHDFIRIAEESGLILPLGEWVIDEACRQLSLWHSQHPQLASLRMAVNISSLQLRNENLLRFIDATLKKYALRGDRLMLEITESAVMDNPTACISRLEALRALGIELAIDDFGTGYSSLGHLKLMPIAALKIDRSFVRDVETDRSDTVICTATIHLAHDLGLQVIAEGIETAAQHELLVSHGCDLLQGYLFSKPLPAHAMQAMLAAGTGCAR